MRHGNAVDAGAPPNSSSRRQYCGPNAPAVTTGKRYPVAIMQLVTPGTACRRYFLHDRRRNLDVIDLLRRDTAPITSRSTGFGLGLGLVVVHDFGVDDLLLV